jgi:hypothetical protein
MNEQEIREFTNEIVADPGVGNLKPGMVAFANTSRFEAATYNEPLTAYAVGYQDPEDLWQLLERIVPGVQVTHRFNFKKQDKASAFLSESDDIRAVGAKFKKVEFIGDEVNARTYNKGLTMTIDKDEMELPGIEEVRTGYLIQRLARNEIARTVALIDSAASNSAKTWSSGTVDPDQDISNMLDSAQQVDGIWKNTVLMGKTAWQYRRAAHRRLLTAGSIASARMTPDEVAADLGIANCIVSDKVKQTSKTTKARLLGAVVYGYYVLPGVTKDDPSDFKRFYSPARGGKFGVFRKEHETGVDITVEHYSVIMSTSGLSTPKLTIS